jgi:hypothetical protein
LHLPHELAASSFLPVDKGGHGDNDDEKRGQGKECIKRERSTKPWSFIVDPFANVSLSTSRNSLKWSEENSRMCFFMTPLVTWHRIFPLGAEPSKSLNVQRRGEPEGSFT